MSAHGWVTGTRHTRREFGDKNKPGKKTGALMPEAGTECHAPFSAVKTALLRAPLLCFGCISWEASKHDRQHCIQKCNTVSGNTQRLQRWVRKGPTDTAGRQAGRQAAPVVPQSACSLEPVALSSGSENAPEPRHPTLEKAESL